MEDIKMNNPDNLTGQPDAALQAARIEEKMKIESQFRSGAQWFFWIAGLSLINTIVLFTGGNWAFIAGLGITQVIDNIAQSLANARYIALIIDLVITGIFILFGVYALKRSGLAFIFGMILYGLDGLIFLVVQDWLSIAFHVFVLYFIYAGYKANKMLAQMESA